MHCRTFFIEFYHGGESWGDTIVNIEPDSVNSHTYYLDGVYGDLLEREKSADFQMITYPNPATGSITLKITHDGYETQGVIRFFGTGQSFIMETPVSLSGKETELKVELNDGFAPGPCFYILEIDNFTVATGKMVIIR
jgi:hypothetical protein